MASKENKTTAVTVQSAIPEDVMNEINKSILDMRSEANNEADMYQQMDDIYLIEGSTTEDLPDEDFIKETLSPDGRNATNGAVRLLTAAGPKFKMRDNALSVGDKNKSSELEKLADALWKTSNRVLHKKNEKTATLGSLLYSDVSIAVKSVKGIKEAFKGKNLTRLNLIEEQTPILFEVLDPKTCWARYDGLGYAAHLTFKEVDYTEAKALYGEEAFPQSGTTKVVIYEYWDYDWHVIKPESGDVIVAEKNNYGFIPISSYIVEGEETFFKKSGQHKHQPFLYGVWKSKTWERLNTLLTIIVTNVFRTGAFPQLVHQSATDDDSLTIDWSTLGGVIKLKPNEKLDALKLEVIKREVLEAFSMMQGQLTESTIYKQALGQPMGDVAFSLVSLMHQAGRLPLISYKDILAYAYADAMNIAFKIIKKDGIGKKEYKSGLKTKLDPKIIPDQPSIECNVEIELPQDTAQNIKMAIEGIEKMLFSNEYALQNLLNIEQPDQMQEDIWAEQYAKNKMMMAMKAKLMQFEKSLTQPALPEGQAGINQVQNGQTPPPQSLPPEIAAQVQGKNSAPQEPPQLSGPEDQVPLAGPVEPMQPTEM